MLRRPFPVLLCALTLLASWSTSAAALGANGTAAGALASALERRDLRALNDIAADGTVFTPAWENVRELIERSRSICIRGVREIARHEQPDRITIDVRIDGLAESAGAARAPLTVPRDWQLEIATTAAGWRIAAARTRERALAASYLSVPQKERRAWIVANDIEHGAFARELADSLLQNVRRSTPEQFAAALEIALDADDAAAAAYCTNRLSTYHRLKSQYAEAEATARRALDHARDAGDPDEMAGALFRIGSARWGARDLAEASKHFAAAGDLHARMRDPRAALKGLYMHAYLAAMDGQLRESLVTGQRLASLARTYGWREGVSSSAFLLGNVFKQLHDPRSAKRHYEAALDEALATANPLHAAMALADLAECELRLGNPRAAQRLLARATATHTLDSGRRATIFILLGEALAAQGRRTEATDALLYAQRLAAIHREGRVGSDALLMLSHLAFEDESYEEALQLAQRAIRTGDTGGALSLDWSAVPSLTLSARALLALGRVDEARDHLQRAVAETENDRRGLGTGIHTSTFFSGRKEPYIALIELLTARGETAEAFRVSEQLKARTLRDVIHESHLAPAASAAEKRREEELRRRVSDLNLALEKTESEETRSTLRANLTAARDELDHFRMLQHALHAGEQAATDAQHTPLHDVAAGTVLVSYVVGEQRTLAFVLKHDGVRTSVNARVIDVSRKRLADAIAALNQHVAMRSAGFRTHARQVHQLLLEPIEDLFHGQPTICIVPDDVLWKVPFHALRTARGSYVIDEAEVYYAPAVAMLRRTSTKTAASAKRRLLAFGDPVRAGWNALGAAREEVFALAELYGADNSRVFIGADANERAFHDNAGAFDVIHVASHAVAAPDRPWYSGLVLTPAPDGSNDGIVEAREVIDLALRADVAVLAACESGGGSILPGEGTIGLSWAFMVAGCPTTVVSAWDAASSSTAQVMLDFHRRLIAGDTKPAALRDAQRRIKRDPRFAHPFYWAPFAVIGAP